MLHIAGRQGGLQLVHRLSPQLRVVGDGQQPQVGKALQAVQIIVLQSGVLQPQGLQRIEPGKPGIIADGVSRQMQLLQSGQRAQRHRGSDAVPLGVDVRKGVEGHQRPQVCDLIVFNHQLFQSGDIHQRCNIADLISGQIQPFQLPAGGQGGDIRYPPAAEIQLLHIRLKGDAAQSDVRRVLLVGVGVNGTAGQGGGQGLELLLADGNALDAQSRQVFQFRQHRKIGDGVIVQIQGTQPLQLRQGADIGNIVIGQVKGGQPAQGAECADIRDAVAGQVQTGQGVQLCHLIHLPVRQAHARQTQ